VSLRKFGFVALGLVLLSVSGLAAIDRPEAFRPDLGVVFIPNLDPNKETASLVTYVLGCGLVYPFSPGSAWSFEPAVDLYTAYYELDALARAVPSMDGEQDAFVVGLILDAPIVLSFRLGEKFRIGVGAGLGFNLRVGIKDSEAPDGTGATINAYFWGNGRFFQPATFLRGEYKLTERVDFGFSARAYWPIFNFWTGEGFPFLDQGIFGGSLGVRYKLDPRPRSAPPSALPQSELPSESPPAEPQSATM
jgi:hypothetical protein